MIIDAQRFQPQILIEILHFVCPYSENVCFVCLLTRNLIKYNFIQISNIFLDKIFSGICSKKFGLYIETNRVND